MGVSEPGPGGINLFSGYMVTNNDGVAGGWTWTSGGVTTAGNWLSPIAPAAGGTQYGFLLNAATMSQTIMLPTNGVYAISFYAGSGSTYYSTENVTLQVDGVTVGHWNAATFGSSMVQVGTNFFANAGSHTFSFQTDTNGATIGSDGYGLCFDLVAMTPYYSGYTANDSLQQVFSDGSWQGTENGLLYIQGKAQDNWTLFVGTNNGVYTWANPLNVSMPNTISIRGGSTNNRPEIIFNTAAADGIYGNTPFTTIRDFIFNVGASVPSTAIIGIDGSNVCFRVSNCQLLNASASHFGIQICTGHNSTHVFGPWGLIDSCQLDFPGGVVYNYINCKANSSVDNWCWSNNMTWGTTNMVVVESSSFYQPSPLPINGAVEGDGGARVCIRYCNITNVQESTHGPESGSGTGTLLVEHYMNNYVLTNGASQIDYQYVQRGGSAVIWSNTYLNQLIGGSSVLTTTMKFWDENAGTNSAFQNFIPAGSVYNSSGFFATPATNNTTGAGPYYLFWGGTHDVGFAFGTNSTGASVATYATIANNVGNPALNTNFAVVYIYLHGTPNTSVTCGIRDVEGDDWWQESKSESLRLFYPTNYPSFEQNGQGSSNNAQIYQPIYIWGNTLPASAFQSIILGHDGGDAPFIQQGRDIFTNSVMPGYVPLVYPHPLVTSSGGGGQGFGLSPPSISQQPVDATYSAGQATFFSLSVAGTTPFAFQWATNGVNVPGATNSSVTGTANTLGVTLVSCVVTNLYGTVTSRSAVETVVQSSPVNGFTTPSYLTQ